MVAWKRPYTARVLPMYDLILDDMAPERQSDILCYKNGLPRKEGTTANRWTASAHQWSESAGDRRCSTRNIWIFLPERQS